MYYLITDAYVHMFSYSHPFLGARFTVVTSSICRNGRRHAGDGLRERGRPSCLVGSDWASLFRPGGGAIRPTLIAGRADTMGRETGEMEPTRSGGGDVDLACGCSGALRLACLGAEATSALSARSDSSVRSGFRPCWLSVRLI